MTSPPLAVAGSRPAARAGVKIPPPLVLFLLALLTRLPLQGRMLYHWDSVNLAFALRHFDVADGAPQAPGYLCYVLLGHAATALMGGDAQRGYALLAVLGSAFAAWAIYDLGRRLWNPRVGWFAALLLLSSPVFWFYGEVALPHTLDALMVIVAATLSWRVWSGEARMAPALALWLGLAGGLREQTLVFLLPVAAAACTRLPWRTILLCVGILAVTTLAWLVPLLSLCGGWHRYWFIVSQYSEGFDRPTSVLLGAGWKGLHHNLSKLIRYTAWAWLFGLVPLALGLGVLRRTRAAPWTRNQRVGLLALWAAPSLFFYVFIHMGQQGLIFVYLPVCLLLSARAGDALTRARPGGQALVAGCVAANALVYLFAPSYLLPGQRLKVLTQATVRDKDRLLEGQMTAIREDLPARGVLMANMWRYPEYYYPRVPLIAFNALREDDGEEVVLPAAPPLPSLKDTTALAWYEPELDVANRSAGRTAYLASHNGVRLRVLRRSPDEHFWVTPTAFGVARNGR